MFVCGFDYVLFKSINKGYQGSTNPGIVDLLVFCFSNHKIEKLLDPTQSEQSPPELLNLLVDSIFYKKETYM